MKLRGTSQTSSSHDDLRAHQPHPFDSGIVHPTGATTARYWSQGISHQFGGPIQTRHLSRPSAEDHPPDAIPEGSCRYQ